jgi:hypothetical protein
MEQDVPGSPTDRRAAGLAEREGMRALIAEIVSGCPRRLAGSASERQGHDILARRIGDRGLDVELEPFRFGTHLYANLVLHFGLALVASGLFFVSPWLALGLHALVGLSYVGDSLHRVYVLRRLLGFRASRNLLATRAADGPIQLRVVLLGHVDAAYTGRMFDPRIVRRLAGGHDETRPLRGLGRPMRFATMSVFALATVDAVAMMVPGIWVLPTLALLSIPALLVVLVNLEVVVRNQVVPGANDNLSGCAAVDALIPRLGDIEIPGVELVFGVTGAEEAGVGGSWALCRQRRREWDPANTVVLGLDGLAGGELRYFQESEMTRLPIARWLEEILSRVAAGEERFSGVRRHEMGVGATDAGPFQAAGYDAVTIGCVDPELGAPRNYHLPSDTPENVDLAEVQLAVDFAERVVREVIVRRCTP